MKMAPFALMALLALPLPALAQAVTAPPSTVPTPLQELPADDGLLARAGRAWDGLLGGAGMSLGPSSHARQYSAHALRQSRDDFTWLMTIAGYKLKEIESSISLLPSLSLTFGQARELTEADREYVERALERHARQNPGTLASMQRSIVRSILEAGELGGFTVEKVEVNLFPLPRVKFQLAPLDAPLGLEASRIMRAIDRLNQRLGTLPGRPPGAGTGQLFEMPDLSPAPIQPAVVLRH